MKWVLLLFTIFICGCQYDPHAHLLATTKPSPSEIIGTYILDQSFLPANINNLPRITVELHGDGTFIAKNIPSEGSDIPDENFLATLVSCTGKWEIDEMGILDDKYKIWGVYLRSENQKIQSPQFTGKYPHLGLIFELGDPDCGYALLMKKQAQQGAAANP
jgi:hypothetical protein